MRNLMPGPSSSEAPSPEPRPISAVMSEVLARYGLNEPPPISERLADYWAPGPARADRELAVA